MTTLESLTIFAVFAAFVVLAFTVAWVALEMLYVSAIDDEPPTAEFSPPPPAPECWIRCSDWEFLPGTWDEAEAKRLDVISNEDYQAMRRMEDEDRQRRENEAAQKRYMDFQAATLEPDDDDDQPGDNWPNGFDLGGSE